MLDIAVEKAFGGYVAWHCENDSAASKVLAKHFPDIPNLGDITTVDFASVEPVDIICGGFPCQDVSCAGMRAGISSRTRSGLWTYFADAIDILRPPVVIIENVRGLLSAKAVRSCAMESDNADLGILRAAGAVIGNLADLGYDAQWTTLAASAIGAPHKRERVFILAGPANAGIKGWEGLDVDAHESPGWPLLTGRGGDALLPTPEAKIAGPDYARMNRERSGGHDLVTALAYHKIADTKWGIYDAAVSRWERLTRPVPAPTEPNTRGNPRLNPQFAEWMMGWPQGWVTDLIDLSRKRPEDKIPRNDALRMIGNGVVPQQAYAALTYLMGER